MKFLQKILITGFVVTSFLLLAGCNTMAGFGQDVQATGHAITKTAQHR